MVFIEQFCGVFSLLFYAASVFEASGATSISPEHSTIILGVITVLGSYGSTYMVDRIGRKTLLCWSAFGNAVGMVAFGAATLLINYGYESTFIKSIPVIALSLSVFVAHVGIFSLTFVVLAEISPQKVS